MNTLVEHQQGLIALSSTEQKSIRPVNETPDIDAHSVRVYENYPSNNQIICCGFCIRGPKSGNLLALGTTCVIFVYILSHQLIVNRYLAQQVHTMTSSFFIITTSVLQGLALYFFLLASSSDPGILRRRYPVDAKAHRSLLAQYKLVWEGNIRETKLKSRTRYPGRKWCGACLSYRPAHSSHCRTCDNCVSYFDHHCVWLGTCVGGGNHRSFLSFLITTATCIDLLIASAVYQMIVINRRHKIFDDFSSWLIKPPGTFIWAVAILISVVAMGLCCKKYAVFLQGFGVRSAAGLFLALYCLAGICLTHHLGVHLILPYLLTLALAPFGIWLNIFSLVQVWMISNNVRTKNVIRENNAWKVLGNGRKSVDWWKVCCNASRTTQIGTTNSNQDDEEHVDDKLLRRIVSGPLACCSSCVIFWTNKHMLRDDRVRWRSKLHEELLLSKEEVAEALADLEKRKALEREREERRLKQATERMNAIAAADSVTSSSTLTTSTSTSNVSTIVGTHDQLELEEEHREIEIGDDVEDMGVIVEVDEHDVNEDDGEQPLSAPEEATDDREETSVGHEEAPSILQMTSLRSPSKASGHTRLRDESDSGEDGDTVN